MGKGGLTTGVRVSHPPAPNEPSDGWPLDYTAMTPWARMALLLTGSWNSDPQNCEIKGGAGAGAGGRGGVLNITIDFEF